MFARLWWKEARQTWRVWGFLALVGMAVQLYLFSYWSDAVSPAGYANVAIVVTMMYLFLVAAAVFAGERENGTLWILDALPAERLRVWSAKASFALVTTLALGILLWLSALAFGRYSSEWQTAGAAALVWGLMALGWGLLWSAILSNALHAAVLAMLSLCLTLLPLVNLQQAPALEATPILLALAALTTGASAWVFRAGGPPRREPRRTRPTALATAVAVPVSDDAATSRRPRRIWTAAVPRLLWQTLRQVRPELWILVGLAVASAVTPLLLTWNSNRYPSDAAPFMFMGAAVLALVAGVMVFNGENRSRTHRFLLLHGARPGVVWAVKLVTWWAAALGLWAMTLASLWPTLPAIPLRGLSSGWLVTWAAWGLTIPFSIAVLCGMTCRRGILAGMIALVATLAVVIPMLALLTAQVLFPWHWPYVAIGLLGISWAWSNDWLYDRPGWKRWARLALYVAAVSAVLAPLYIADRAWGMPNLPPRRAEAFFQHSRVVASVAEEDNAAPLYREAYLLISRNAYPISDAPKAPAAGGAGMAASAGSTNGPRGDRAPAWTNDARLLDQQSFDPPPAWVPAWLTRLEPALVKLREGARRPVCRYIDLRTATEFDRLPELPIDTLILPIAVSARVRLGRGDLDGAWVEVETLVRLVRQYSYTSRWPGQVADPVASALVLRWAADPRQTVATLEKAARAWKAIPPGASPVERFRVDAAIFHNTLDLPRHKLIDKLLYGQADPNRKIAPSEKLWADVKTTPWEVARTRKVFDLLAGAQIQRFEHVAFPYVPQRQGMPVEHWRWFDSMVDPNWGFLVEEDGRTVALSPEDLNTLSFTTPLLRYASMGGNSTAQGQDQTMKNAIWLVLLLRLHQARHDGKLPDSLDEIFMPDQDNDLVATTMDLADPYSGKPFGYVVSHGQMLLPIGTIEPPSSFNSDMSDTRFKPAEGCRLLYSVGPDGVDDRAERNVGLYQKGDFVFPLKDDVKPPGLKPR